MGKKQTKTKINSNLECSGIYMNNHGIVNEEIKCIVKPNRGDNSVKYE